MIHSVQMHPGNLDAKSGPSEIVDAMEESSKVLNMVETSGKRRMLKRGQICSVEEDINQLFEAIDIRNSGKNTSVLKHRNSLRKSAMKRPMHYGSSPASGNGISETVSLKQALRGLCISQASEMAAMKRLSKQAGSSRASEAGTIKELFKSVVVENPLVPEASVPSVHGCNQFVKGGLMNESNNSSVALVDIPKPNAELSKVTQVDHIGPFHVHGTENRESTVAHTTSSKTFEKLSLSDQIIPASASVQTGSMELNKEREGTVHFASPLSSDSNVSSEVIKSASTSRHIFGPVLRNKAFFKRKIKQDFGTDHSISSHGDTEVDKDFAPGTCKTVCQGPNVGIECGNKVEETCPASSIGNTRDPNAMDIDPDRVKPVVDSTLSYRTLISSTDDKSRSREKGDFSQSSKSSIGEYSSSTSISEESTLSGSSRIGYRPHMSKDLRWESIHYIQKHHGKLGMRHFKLLKKIGSGDMGNVYLAELIGTSCLFGLKIMDTDFLVSRKKMARVQMERDILQMLDHPFLPTLFSHFTTDKYMCLVMEYCPGGDLHVLRQKQPNKRFSEQAARFYVAEVLLALEYLHMLGVVYRDLKPENILIREDGHIMLSDFDLSFRCAVDPILLLKSTPVTESPKRKTTTPCTASSCIQPFCLQPLWQVPCFTPKFISTPTNPRKLKADVAVKFDLLPQLVAEPTSARSNSFVGTHEYLAPEVIRGEGHGSAVDWWTLGIFLYELVYGRTPFKGSGNEDTLSNVTSSQGLKFPWSPIVTSDVRDLIRGLLVKEPMTRLGSTKGAAEIKQHPFFHGLNWALIRCAVPPELPTISELGNAADLSLQKKESSKCQEEHKNAGDDLAFELF